MTKPDRPRKRTTEYQSYLMRFWRNSPTDPWRATLQNALTGEQWHFADSLQLFAFLQERLADRHQPDQHEN